MLKTLCFGLMLPKLGKEFEKLQLFVNSFILYFDKERCDVKLPVYA